jgi:RHS repeat-associated protein
VSAAAAAAPRHIRPAPGSGGGVGIAGGNVSGAMLTDAGCFQTRFDTPNISDDIRRLDLPGWVKFGSRSFATVSINALGWAMFGGDIGLFSIQAPLPSADYSSYFRGAPDPIITPMFHGAGTKAVSYYGYVTYAGRPALCVSWTNQAHVDYASGNRPVNLAYTNDYQLLLVDRSDQGYEDFDIVINYGSIEFAGNNGPPPGTGFGGGWRNDLTSVELPNSWGPGLLDSNPTGLIHSSLGSSQLGRYVWQIRNGQAAPSLPTGGTYSVPTATTPGSWGENPTNGESEPVNTATGSYYTSVTDLSLPGIGVPFELTRSYNSADPSSSTLGPGWTHSLAARLTIQPNGDALAKSGDGQEIFFTRNGDGSFSAPGFARSSLASITGGYELITKDQLHYGFDTQGRLTSKTDRNGQGLTLAYGGDGLLATVTDSVDRLITLTHSGGHLTQVTLPDGRDVVYGYDGSGRLASVTDVREGTTQYTYDAGGRLKKIIDQNTHTVVDNTYGPDGRVSTQLDARGKQSSFGWDAATQTSTFTDARQNQWKDVYRNNVLVERIDPLGNRTRYRYDAQLNLTDIVDARNLLWRMVYDARGNLLTRISPTNVEEEWSYNAFNEPITYEDGRTFVTDFGYDAAGNLTSVTSPDADGPGPLGRPQTLYGRDPAGTGLLTSVTDPRGKQTTFAYTNGNLTEVRTQLQNRTTMGYDGAGRLTTLIEPRGHAQGENPLDFTWTYAYNEANQLETQGDPLGSSTTLDYDPAGNLLFREDARLHRTTYGYDEANHLRRVTAPDPDGPGSLPAPVTQYAYDDVGNIDTRTDANQRVTDYDYDAVNRLSRATYPGGRQWTYAYDEGGNVSEVVDANGNATPTAGDGRTSMRYDEYDRLSSITYSDTTPQVNFTYDANGNRTQMSDGSGQELYTYDRLNRITQVTRGSDFFGYTYDMVNLVQVRYPDATTVSYAYDDEERLQSATSASQTTSYAYDLAGNLAETTLPAGNGYVETRAYDRAGRLTEIRNQKGAATLSRFVSTLDPVGNPTRIDRERTGQALQTQTFTYDDMDRLSGVCFQTGCPGPSDPFIRWTYDGVGNRLSEQRPSGTATSTYNVADELTQAGTTSYAYDQNGNELSAGPRTFTWDLANRLRTTTLGSATTTYVYDGDGKRLQASTGSQASKKTNYLWDVSGSLPQIALERDGGNSLLRRYLYGQGRISMTSGTSSYYFHHGTLGSVANVTSSTGAPQWSYVYEPYGALRTETKENNKAPASFMKFTGEYLDPTGLYHLRARQYDPGTGRFLTRDPLSALSGEPASSSFVYANNQPTAFVDPLGLRWCDPLCVLPDTAESAGEAVVGVLAEHPVEILAGAQIVACVAGGPVVCGAVATANLLYAGVRAEQAIVRGCGGDAAAIVVESVAGQAVSRGGVALIGRTRKLISGPIGKRGRQQYVDLSLTSAQRQQLRQTAEAGEGVLGLVSKVSPNC